MTEQEILHEVKKSDGEWVTYDRRGPRSVLVALGGRAGLKKFCEVNGMEWDQVFDTKQYRIRLSKD